MQTDSFESEIESLLANKKKKLDKDKQERMDELKSRLERHRFHIRKLETLLRMLDNMSVEVQQVCQTFINFYVGTIDYKVLNKLSVFHIIVIMSFIFLF